MEHSAFEPVPLPRYPVGKRELRFAVVTAILAVGLWNSILYGGFNLGFAFFSLGLLLCNVWYLKGKGHKFGGYGTALLIFSAALLAGFARSSDAVVKAAALLAALFAVNLSFCLAAKQNRRSSGGFSTLFDAPRAFFAVGFGGMGPSLRGLEDARKNTGAAGKKGSAALLGIVIAVPVVAVILPLLMRSDAAFEGLVNLLPERDWAEPFWSLATGLFAAWVLFARGLGLHNKQKPEPARGISRKLNAITVNILLGAVCAVYLAYLFSQLAYFSGGFLGILPEDYTLAAYARRGFFEMAWLSGINLCLVLFGSGLVERREKLPAATRILCLFLGAVTLFLIGSASAKMLLYIRSYGLTRLRILTQTVMVWLAVSAVLVCIRLNRLAFPYMKGVILTALALVALLLWGDVDSFAARYNVRAYQAGRLETVDMDHLSRLGDGAVPYLAELENADDPKIAERATSILYYRNAEQPELRSWNYSRSEAARVLSLDTDGARLRQIGRQLDLDLHQATLLEYRDSYGGFHGDGELAAVMTLPESIASHAESMMSFGAPWWHGLPLSRDAELALYGGMDGDTYRNPLFTDENGHPLALEVTKGWYYLYDAQGQPYLEQSLFSRPSFNFCLALYDIETRTLYYFQLDT